MMYVLPKVEHESDTIGDYSDTIGDFHLKAIFEHILSQNHTYLSYRHLLGIINAVINF